MIAIADEQSFFSLSEFRCVWKSLVGRDGEEIEREKKRREEKEGQNRKVTFQFDTLTLYFTKVESSKPKFHRLWGGNRKL